MIEGIIMARSDFVHSGRDALVLATAGIYDRQAPPPPPPPPPTTATATATTMVICRSSSSSSCRRKCTKKKMKQQQPQRRGLGVAQLEKIRVRCEEEERRGKIIHHIHHRQHHILKSLLLINPLLLHHRHHHHHNDHDHDHHHHLHHHHELLVNCAAEDRSHRGLIRGPRMTASELSSFQNTNLLYTSNPNLVMMVDGCDLTLRPPGNCMLSAASPPSSTTEMVYIYICIFIS